MYASVSDASVDQHHRELAAQRHAFASSTGRLGCQQMKIVTQPVYMSVGYTVRHLLTCERFLTSKRIKGWEMGSAYPRLGPQLLFCWPEDPTPCVNRLEYEYNI